MTKLSCPLMSSEVKGHCIVAERKENESVTAKKAAPLILRLPIAMPRLAGEFILAIWRFQRTGGRLRLPLLFVFFAAFCSIPY